MLNAADIVFERHLRTLLSEAAFSEATPQYLEEPRGRYAGHAGLLVKPRSTEEVSVAVKAAHDASVPVVPYGGGTGLVGGQVAPDGPAPLIVSLERMTALRKVYPSENVVVAEAGMILADLQNHANSHERLFPMSLASEGSARLGGILATNAGGVNVLRYGNTRDLCLGLEVVLANGSVWNGLSRLRKDNSGYDLRNLMIGSEGSLGIITAAALRLAPKPAQMAAAMFVVSDPVHALSLLNLAQRRLGNTVSAFELMHRQGFEFLRETLPDIRLPFESVPEWAVLVDLGLSTQDDAQAVLLDFAEAARAADLISDGVIAQSDTQRADFWSVREHIPEANRRIGSVSSHDVSVPLSAIPEFIAEGKKAIAALGPMRVNCFGHVGDGNLHFNVFPDVGKTRADYEDRRAEIKRTVHNLVSMFGGSVSAEHGIGRLKVDDLERYSDPTKLAMLRSIKDALDPKGILNPGVIVRKG